ncbi:MAG: UvrD-helicase domain-containing protein [Hydrogenophaga sp.]|uniref:UvrD-helicase domain-containing protein n=1 Tax=Hydrogenophaga sp. TaxID=1904254 RepID=UPI002623AA28|nr:UvrD-helicase domain-containing protein [Hydrogenophaga sp.]MDM7942644.1 UvrD-helicase domain-containing protein [Hydrogenophaga sp.]
MNDTAAYSIDGAPVTREAFYALACDPARSIAVEACAGAGKTWMLVSRILRALLDGCPPQDILAITFTRKAAGEMRKRLGEELRRWAGLSDAELVAALRQRGLPATEAERRAPQARSLHARVTALGRPVQVRTFHGWFAALLRGAPLSVLQELQLPVQYELLEDDTQVIDQVWPRFYGALAVSASDRQDYVDAVATHGRHQAGQALRKALHKRVEFALADAAGVVQRSVATMVEQFPGMTGFDDPLRWLVEEASNRQLLSAAAVALGQASAASFAAKGSELEQALTDQHGARVIETLLTQKNEPRKFSDKIAGIEQVRAAQDTALRVLAARSQQQAWLHHQRMARLTRVLLTCFADLKRERGWVDMNDVETAARRLLGDAELSGWLQQRLDARVRHVLIDEFQDTNPLQWQALYGWLSAYAGAGPGEAPCVFLVGDPKQSIYRFRRAEPQVFKAAQAFVVQGLSGALLTCDHTRRCAGAVVDVLNSAMLAAVQAGDYSSDFRPHTTESLEAGQVVALPQVLRSARERGGGGDVASWRDSLVTPRVLMEDTLSALEARQAADWLAGEIGAGRLSADGVMVLARRRERLAWMFEALRERGIASEQPEKLDLCEAPAVQDVVALLDALVSTRHDLSLARALKSPLFGWSDDALAWLARLQQHWTVRPGADARPTKPSWWAVLQRFAALTDPERAALPPVSEPLALAFTASAVRLLRYRHWVQGLPPHDALSAIYGDGDVLARFARAVPASQRAGVLAQLRDLLANALAQDGGRFLTPYRFVRALKAGGIKATPTHNSGAVRLLTIHGAKGLEAHTVLMLDTDTGPSRPESMGVLIDWPGEAPVPRRFVFLASERNPPACAATALAVEQQARSLEELNALYVALTRAETRLVISSFEPHARGAAPTWYERLLPLTRPLDLPAAALPTAGAAGPLPDAFNLPVLPPLAQAPGTAVVTQVAPLADDERTRIGLALHRLLQWHPTGAQAFDWTAAHTRAVSLEFALSPAQAAQAQAMARRIVQGEAAWAWDGAMVDATGNEVDIFHGGELLRLDRLVRRTDTGDWWVLDFKSAENPQQQKDLLIQMQRYRRAVQAARPGAVVRLAFINLHGRLIELQDTPIAP